MKPETSDKVAELFRAARSFAPAERSAFLDRQSDIDASLRAEVMDLLDQDELANDEEFLAAPSQGGWFGRTKHRVAPDSSRSTTPPGDRHGARLVHDSDPPQRALSLTLLWDRMRIGSLIILGSNSAFLAKDAWDGRSTDGTYAATFWTHCAVLLTTTVVVWLLWSRRSLSLETLRALELVMVGISILFYAQYQIHDVSIMEWGPCAAPGREAQVISWTGDSCVLRWFAFLVCYGFFVPNTWGRCALVVAGIALCPIAVMVGVGLREGTLGQLTDALFEMVAWLAIASSMAIYGSHKIAQMRQQADEARKLGQYRLKHRLGSGGMGEVYLAEHARLKRPCAIKLIRDELVGDPITLSRFQREVQTTAMLAHPNTVRIYDYGVADDGTFYYTMEYLPGLTLQELVNGFGPLPPERAVYFLTRACSALHEAHGMGLIHRDLKPGNLIASEMGGIPDVLKLLDFGLVRATPSGPGSETLSFQGFIAGTPAYLSPEQAAGRTNVDARSDIYSLGAVGYFLLGGRPPFEGETPAHLMVAHLEQAVPPLRVPGREVPADLEAVIRRCLEKDPADRFPSVKDLEEALAACRCADDWTESAAAEWWQAHPITEPSSENA